MGRALRLDHMGGRALQLGQTWQVSALEISHLGSCHLGKYPWEVALGKHPWEVAQGKKPFGKYLTSNGIPLKFCMIKNE